MKRSMSDGDLSSSSKKKAKDDDYEDMAPSESTPATPSPMKRSISDGDLSSSSEKKAKHEDVGFVVYPPHVRCSIISTAADFPPPSNHRGDANIWATPRVVHIYFDRPPEPVDPKICLDEAWGLLKPAITCIFLLDDPDSDSFSCEAIFRAVDMAWLTNSGEALNKLILDECGTYISTAIQDSAEHCNDDDPSLFLSLLEKSWLDFSKKLEFLCTFAGYRRKLDNLVLDLFPTHLFSASQVRDKLLSIILHRVRDQRLGKSVDTSQLHNLMCMFNGTCFHKWSFLEKSFLDSATEFYAAEAMQVLEHSDVHQYLNFVERRLGEEKSKCRELYFFTIFKDELIKIVTRELLVVRACAILEKGFDKLMDEMHLEDLGRMYHLFSEADLVHHINDALSSYISKTGEKITSEGDKEEFMARVDKIFTTYFHEDPMLDKTLEKYFGLPCWKDRLIAHECDSE